MAKPIPIPGGTYSPKVSGIRRSSGPVNRTPKNHTVINVMPKQMPNQNRPPVPVTIVNPPKKPKPGNQGLHLGWQASKPHGGTPPGQGGKPPGQGKKKGK